MVFSSYLGVTHYICIT